MNGKQLRYEDVMTEYFDEKSEQISPRNITAFGINIESRYGKSQELVELIEFAHLVAEAGVSKY